MRIGLTSNVSYSITRNTLHNIHNSVYPDSTTPLHIAAECGKQHILETLLQKGADKEAHTTLPKHATDNNSPLLITAKNKKALEILYIAIKQKVLEERKKLKEELKKVLQ